MQSKPVAELLSGDKGVFDRYQPLIEAGNGLSMSQVCGITGLESSTVQNWVKRGFVPHPVNKKYGSRHLARIMLISSLREGMRLERVGQLLSYLNGDTDDESDDIISEEELYDLFCTVSTTEGRDLGSVIAEQLDIRGITGELREKLKNALTAMTYAAIAGRYIEKTEMFIQTIL